MIKEYAHPILDEIGQALRDMDYDILWKMVAEIHGANRIFLHGVGTAELCMKNFAMYLKHFGYRSHIVGDATCPAIKPGDTLFIVSETGETPVSLFMAKKAKEIGEIKVLLATAAKGSSLEKLADYTVHFGSNEVDSIQPPGALFDGCVVYGLDWALRACVQQRLGRRDGAGPLHSNLE